ncbi:capsular polysaccharide export protein, LipB/KpsS family [Shimia gijangensis]|uniref:capsular polysaccharide export protein, LipB/KpsS family n=1 Tax=Shimia gijangensis TaxID=1470563 RepID=UPI001114BB06|nr:hypothetical protein [Shimia gijangensis]
MPASWLTQDGKEIPPFYQKAFEGLDGLGVPYKTIVLDRERVLQRIDADECFHLINHGNTPHPRALMVGLAYLYPFWHVDPKGIRAFSSIGETRFRPGQIDGDTAREFLTGLRHKWVEPRKSRYEQQRQIAEDLPEGATAVFLQSEKYRLVEETCFMDCWQMIEACLEADQGPVVVKPHPLDLDQDTYERLVEMQNQHTDLHISLDNIHDILDSCERVVTINSAVGIEAYMHRKPVILCGQSDFHHIADVARSPAALTELLKQEPSGRVHAKFLYWYFAQNCVNAGRGNVARQILRKVRAAGYSLE